MLKEIDGLMPLTSFADRITSMKTLPVLMKIKLNLRERLMTLQRLTGNAITKSRLDKANKATKSYYNTLQSSKI